MSIFRALMNEIDSNRNVTLMTVVGGESELITGQQALFDHSGKTLKADAQLDKLFYIPTTNPGIHAIQYNGKEMEVMVEPILPNPALIIFGSGHIAECLAKLAKLLMYKVNIVDDREQYANSQHFPDADKIWCGNVDQSVQEIPFHANCFAVIVTRGHQTDAVSLQALLDKPIPYIGLVGSKRKLRFIRQMFWENGIDLSQQKNLFAPIGLDFHSETPQEIALSILSELQLFRHGGTGKQLSTLLKKEKVHPYDERRVRQDPQLFEIMAQAEEAKRAFISVIIVRTEGHVPRGVGSRALIWADGSIYGTTGGGRRESEIIQMALELLKEGKNRQQAVDFRGTYDDFQPVCGGKYTFFMKSHRQTFP
jgi:xanthine dehydrogenase accessory factor